MSKASGSALSRATRIAGQPLSMSTRLVRRTSSWGPARSTAARLFPGSPSMSSMTVQQHDHDHRLVRLLGDQLTDAAQRPDSGRGAADCGERTSADPHLQKLSADERGRAYD